MDNSHRNFTSSLNINFSSDTADFEGQLLNAYIVKKGLFIAKENLLIKSEEINNFINDIKSSFKNLKIYNMSINKWEHIVVIEGKDIFIYIIKDVSKKDPKDSLFLYAKNFEVMNKLINIYKKYAAEWDTEVKVSFTKYAFVNGQIAIDKTYKYLKHYETIKKFYYPFIDIDLFVKEFIESKENILILTGKPGVGKSKFPLLIIKHLLENPELIEKLQNYEENNEILEDDDKILYVGYAKNIEMLANDMFWSKIGGENIIIFDDLDFILTDRSESREDTLKNQFLSHLLSFTDGIEKNKIKIIITTNQDYKDIDQALLRKGRLFDILRFRGLTEEEALELWEKYGLDKKDFKKYIPELKKEDGYILQSDIASLIENIKRNEKYIKKEDYIKDPSIRILSKNIKKRKIVGFD